MSRRSIGLKQLHKLMGGEATPSEIEICVRDDPSAALICGVDSLTNEQIAACAAHCPALAILWASRRLDAETLDKCVRRAPAMALRIVPDELTTEQFRECERRAPRAAKETLTLYFSQFHEPPQSPNPGLPPPKMPDYRGPPQRTGRRNPITRSG